jgi:hypothetical protein
VSEFVFVCLWTTDVTLLSWTDNGSTRVISHAVVSDSPRT